MLEDAIRQNLQDIFNGACLKEQGNHCSAIRDLLITSFGISPTVEAEFQNKFFLKEKHSISLIEYAKWSGL